MNYTYQDGFVITQQMTRTDDLSYECHNAKNGEFLWKTDSKIFVNTGNPMIYKGKVYLGALDGFYCLDVQTGKTLWKHARDNTKKIEVFINQIISENDRIYTNSYLHTLYCFDIDNGNVVWSVLMPEGTSHSMIYDDNNIFLIVSLSEEHQVKVVKYNAKSGEVLWTTMTEGYVFDEFVVDDKLLLVSEQYQSPNAGMLVCLDKNSGEILWSLGSSSDLPVAGYDKEAIFFGIEPNMISKLDFTGKKIWGTSVECAPLSIKMFNDTIYVWSENVMASVEKKTGKLNWVQRIDFSSILSVDFSDSCIYIGDNSSSIICLDRKNGDRLSEVSLGGPSSYEVLVSDDLLFTSLLFRDKEEFNPFILKAFAIVK